MTLKDTISNDLLLVETDLQNPVFTWDGQDYICIPSSDEKILSLERGGYQVQKVLTLTVRTNQFPDNIFPASQDIITYRNSNYGIADVKLDVTAAIVRLICVSDTRGS